MLKEKKIQYISGEEGGPIREGYLVLPYGISGGYFQPLIADKQEAEKVFQELFDEVKDSHKQGGERYYLGDYEGNRAILYGDDGEVYVDFEEVNLEGKSWFAIGNGIVCWNRVDGAGNLIYWDA